MRTSNHEVDGPRCQYQQVFFDDRGQCHYDHVYATELFSNRSMRGFGVRGDGEDPPGAARGAASLPGGDEDRLPGLSVYQSLPRKFVHVVEALTRRRHRDNTPKYRR